MLTIAVRTVAADPLRAAAHRRRQCAQRVVHFYNADARNSSRTTGAPRQPVPRAQMASTDGQPTNISPTNAQRPGPAQRQPPGRRPDRRRAACQLPVEIGRKGRVGLGRGPGLPHLFFEFIGWPLLSYGRFPSGRAPERQATTDFLTASSAGRPAAPPSRQRAARPRSAGGCTPARLRPAHAAAGSAGPLLAAHHAAEQVGVGACSASSSRPVWPRPARQWLASLLRAMANARRRSAPARGSAAGTQRCQGKSGR